MRRITSRFVLLIATAAVLPLVIFGSRVDQARCEAGPRRPFATVTRKVAKQASEQIAMYMRHNIRVLQSVGTNLRRGESGAYGSRNAS